MKDNMNTDLDIELMTDYAIDVSESANGLCVLIKHDYYSADNDNGKAMLDCFLNSLTLASERIYLLIITDSAVKLLETSDKIKSLIKSVNMTLIDNDSAAYYDVIIDSYLTDKVHAVPMSEITDQIIESRPGLIIE